MHDIIAIVSMFSLGRLLQSTHRSSSNLLFQCFPIFHHLLKSTVQLPDHNLILHIKKCIYWTSSWIVNRTWFALLWSWHGLDGPVLDCTVPGLRDVLYSIEVVWTGLLVLSLSERQKQRSSSFNMLGMYCELPTCIIKMKRTEAGWDGGGRGLGRLTQLLGQMIEL